MKAVALKQYALSNMEGVSFDSCFAKSARAARAIFAQKYIGEFQITSMELNDSSDTMYVKIKR